MKQRLIRGAIGFAGVSLLAGAVTIVPASAKSPTLITQCGTVISKGGNYALGGDLNCPVVPQPNQFNPAIVIAHNGVHFSFNGFSLTGSDTTNATSTEQVGLVTAHVQNIVISGPGSVSGFDAGIALEGTSYSTVQGVSVHDNINHVLLTGGVAGSCTNPSTTGNPCYPAGYGDPTGNPCNFGDGIIVDNSSFDMITGNTASHNGPFSGIALVDASNSDTVVGNAAVNQTVSNILAASTPGAGLAGPCGPFGAAIVGRGRPHQDIGIRVEGPGANNNTVNNNLSNYNQLEGISVHSHVCSTSPQFGGPPPGADNVNNLIENNTVTGNGVGLPLSGGIPTGFDAGQGNGISLLQEGPTGIVCPGDHETITGNTVTYNAGNGVNLPGRNSSNNTVSNNTITHNSNHGVELTGGSSVQATILNGANNDTITGNTIQNNGHDGIRLDAGSASTYNSQPVIAPGASNNTITSNTISGNGGNGIELRTLFTTTPSVVAGTGADNNTVSGNSISSNGIDGILAAGPMSISQSSPDGASGNTFNGNTASGNPTFDAEDDNTNCDSNSWGATTADTFGTTNQSCIN